MSIKIINPGLLSTIQDIGRIGYQEAGFSTSGALDQRALQIANILVNNSKDEAVIEMTLMGATMEFETSNVIAVTGGDLNPMLNRISFPMYTAKAVKQGDRLAFGFAKNGCRAYVAFAGGLKIEEVLGRKSTNLKCGIGGFSGRALKIDDSICFCAPLDILPGITKRTISFNQRNQVNDRKDRKDRKEREDRKDTKEREDRKEREEKKENEVVIRVILGPQTDYFTKKGMDTFLSEVYKITNESDRMGCKLDGPAIESKLGVDIISDGIPFGGIQIPSNGKPIVMLADRQTTGGYAKIATIISVDIPLFVQRKPGDCIRFEAVTIEKAQKSYRKAAKEIERIRRKFCN